LLPSTGRPQRRERVGRVGRDWHLRLVLGRALHAARAEHVEREHRDAGGVELLRPEVEFGVVDAAGAVHQHDGGNLLVPGGQ